jgi:Uma2 family endonuclease
MPLAEQADKQRRGMVIGGCGVVLSAETLVVPDLLFVSRERLSILGEQYIEGAPDLLAEILTSSSASLDQVLRRSLYARYGVKHYWLAHPIEEWVRAYELGADGSYELVAEAHKNEVFSAPPFPDLLIRLSDLWDDLGDD